MTDEEPQDQLTPDEMAQAVQFLHNFRAMGREVTESLVRWGMMKEVGNQHALINHRTLEADNAYRQLGRFWYFCLMKDVPPVPQTVPAIVHEFEDHRARRKSTRKGGEIVIKHINGTEADIQGIVAEYKATRAKRTTWYEIRYHLDELNHAWAKEFERLCPLNM